ncbi:MAG: hypothetical protein JXB10_13180 [Pirellulales bacterium]|nr:hypothetical protein [Pirellulales bacterium]
MYSFSTIRAVIRPGQGHSCRIVGCCLSGISAALLCLCASGLPGAELSRPAGRERARDRNGESARQLAIGALPLEKLDAQDRKKVRAVLENLTLYHHMPVRVIDCDPDLYLFLTRHPDVVVNIWKELRISQLQLQETAPRLYRMKESSGTTATVELLYQSYDTQLLYVEGEYQGAVARSVGGRALFLLKTGYLRDTDDRYYISNRLDMFLSVDPGAVQWVTKTLQPIFGKVADHNFYQTVAFVGSLSRTIEVNSRGVQRLASRLQDVSPQVRGEFFKLTDDIAQKPTAVALRQFLDDVETARRQQQTIRR